MCEELCVCMYINSVSEWVSEWGHKDFPGKQLSSVSQPITRPLFHTLLVHLSLSHIHIIVVHLMYQYRNRLMSKREFAKCSGKRIIYQQTCLYGAKWLSSFGWTTQLLTVTLCSALFIKWHRSTSHFSPDQFSPMVSNRWSPFYVSYINCSMSCICLFSL